MSEAAADELGNDDFTVDDIPVVDLVRRRGRPVGGWSMGALALSVLFHVAAAAAVIGWAITDHRPELSIQGGSGTADFGSAADGGDGPRDLQADLPGESSAAAAASVPTQLPDARSDAVMSGTPHATEDLLPQGTSPLFPAASLPAPNLTARFPQHALNLPSSAQAQPGTVGGVAETASDQAGVGGTGGNGTGGGAGREGSGGPVGLPGNKPPVYPRSEFRRGITGTVKLRIIVLEDGSSGDVSVAESSNVPALDESAVAAARRWRWTPPLEAGLPVRVEVIKPVVFEIRDRSRG